MSAAALLREAQDQARALRQTLARAAAAVTAQEDQPGEVTAYRGRQVLAYATQVQAVASGLHALRLVVDGDLVRMQRENAYLANSPPVTRAGDGERAGRDGSQ